MPRDYYVHDDLRAPPPRYPREARHEVRHEPPLPRGYEHLVHPDFDARNYVSHAARSSRHEKNRSEISKERGGHKESNSGREPAGGDRVGHGDRDSSSKDRRKSKKSKHKGKHSRGERGEEKKKKTKDKVKPLVEYDDVSSGSDVYSSDHRGQSPIRSRVSPNNDRQKRLPSPASALKEYLERSHSNSPVPRERDRSPSSHSRRKNKSSKQPSEAPKAYKTADPPKAYAHIPKAYRQSTRTPSDTQSPTKSGKRRRDKASRSPSPHGYASRRRSSTSPHR